MGDSFLRRMSCKVCDLVKIFHFVGSFVFLFFLPRMHMHRRGFRLGVTIYWRASEASETLSGLFNRESYITRKMVPIMGRASS